MICYADSSFLFTVYLVNPASPKALAWIQQSNTPLSLTSFGAFELRNALRAAVIRRTAVAAQVAAGLADLQGDITAGRLMPVICDWEAVYAQAEQISALCTPASGHRALDVLHVAAALVLETNLFLTFDARQAALATQAGLAVGP